MVSSAAMIAAPTSGLSRARRFQAPSESVQQPALGTRRGGGGVGDHRGLLGRQVALASGRGGVGKLLQSLGGVEGAGGGADAGASLLGQVVGGGALAGALPLIGLRGSAGEERLDGGGHVLDRG